MACECWSRTTRRLADRCRAGHIHRNRRGSFTSAGDLILERLQLAGLPCGKCDACAVRGEHARELPAQPLARTRDEYDFAPDIKQPRHPKPSATDMRALIPAISVDAKRGAYQSAPGWLKWPSKTVKTI